MILQEREVKAALAGEAESTFGRHPVPHIRGADPTSFLGLRMVVQSKPRSFPAFVK